MKTVEQTSRLQLYCLLAKGNSKCGFHECTSKSNQLDISYWSVILLSTQCLFLPPSPWMKPLKDKATEHFSSVVQAPDVQQVGNASHRINWFYPGQRIWFP